MQPTTNASQWSIIAQTIHNLIEKDATNGVIVILLSVAVFLTLLVGATWAITRIIKTKNAPTGKLFKEDVFSHNVLNMIKQLVAFNAERDRLSRKHEYIHQSSIIRDQMVIVEGVQDQIKNKILIALSESQEMEELKQHYAPDMPITESSMYIKFQYNLEILMSEIFVFLRRAAKENHLVEKTEDEFFTYTSNKLKRLKTLADQSIKIKTRDVSVILILSKIYDEQWGNIQELYINLFRDMRVIASSYKNEMEKDEAEFESRWSNFIASIPDMLIDGAVVR